MAKLRFKMKKGMGTHYLPGMKAVHPGDEIKCEKEELGGALDKFEQLDPDPEPEKPKVGLKLLHVGGGYYNVVNDATGKVLNDRPLKKEVAEEMLTEKQKEDTDEAQPKMNVEIVGVKKGKFDVVNLDTGTPINTQPLSEKEAKEMVEGLTKEKEK